MHIQIGVNIPFIYKLDYRNIITKLEAIILSRFSSPFIDRITKKRLIRSIPCKRKKKFHFTAHTRVHWCASKRWEEWAKVTRCNVFSKQWGNEVLTAKFDTVGGFLHSAEKAHAIFESDSLSLIQSLNTGKDSGEIGDILPDFICKLLFDGPHLINEPAYDFFSFI